MTHDIGGVHHAHKRKRIHQKLEKFPHPVAWKRWIDNAIYIIIFVGPIMTIPQVLKIWIEKNAESIALSSWVTYGITSFFWLAYAIAHKEKPLIISGVLWIILYSLVIIGRILYG